jgi:hypothetical protein
MVAQLHDLGAQGVRRQQAAHVGITDKFYRLKHINILHLSARLVKTTPTGPHRLAAFGPHGWTPTPRTSSPRSVVTQRSLFALRSSLFAVR